MFKSKWTYKYEKKNGQEVFVNKKEKYIYYGIAVFVSILFIVFWITILTERNAETELDVESKLPPGKMVEEKQQQKENEMIRIVIKTNGFKQIAHPQLGFQAENGLIVTAGEEKKECTPKEVWTVAPDDVLFQKGHIRIEPKSPSDKITVTTLNRGYGTPSYRGCFELMTTAEGIVLVNELAMEEYLYAVVPSEMPASYEPEALKTQAVCARSYAYCQMQEQSYPEYNAHVDDSTAFQVYGNSQEQETAIRAVDETKGEKLWYHGRVATAYYYSTSCGKSAGIEAWGTAENEMNSYLQSVNICDDSGKFYEENLPWYKWTATIPEQTLSNLMQRNTAVNIGTLQDVTVTKRGAGGIALQMIAKGSLGSVTVNTENKIRRAFGGSGYQIEKHDGTVADSRELLPSAFFTIEKSGGSYIIRGGGFGHGIGMSQNGANEMAKAGKTYKEILGLFYQGAAVE